MKRKITFLLMAYFVIILWPFAAISQDLMVKKNGDEILSKVLEITSSEVKYKKFDNQDGPIYSILKSDLLFIKYQNGTKELFNTEDKSLKTNKIETNDENKDDEINRLLILENTTNQKRIIFKESQGISVKYKTKEGYLKKTAGILVDIRKDNIIIGTETIALSDIYSIFYVRKSREVLSIAGGITSGIWAGLFVFTGVFYDGILITACGLTISSYLIKRNIVLGEKFILKIE